MNRKRPRIVVTGAKGQFVLCLKQRALQRGDVELIAVGRPHIDLTMPQSIAPVLERLRPDIIVSAAAYTAVDHAESDELTAMTINAVAPGQIAAWTAVLDIPLIHLSTDYVFDGTKRSAYVETDPVGPLNVYGRSKAEGERAVAAGNSNHVIIRTTWLYSPFGNNFLKTMLRLREERDRVAVVDDQVGNPTSALDLADGVLTVARNLLDRCDPAFRGIFHMSSGGSASWADFAAEIFRSLQNCGGPSCAVERVSSCACRRPAARPANSSLDCSRLSAVHGVRLPEWQGSVAAVVEFLAGGEVRPGIKPA